MNKVFLNKYQVIAGLIILTCGCIIYIIDRPPWQTVWVSNTITLYTEKQKVFGSIGDYLPSFFHVISFSLMVAGIIADKLRQYLYIIGFWLTINLIFEILQLDAFQSITKLNWLRTYSFNGVFDFKDLIAIFLGGFIAFVFLTVTRRKGIRNVS